MGCALLAALDAIFVAANTPLSELLGFTQRAPAPAVQTADPVSVPAPATEEAKPAEEPEPERPPIFGGFPYLYSVLSRGVLNLQLLPEEMTEDELIELARVQVKTNSTRGCLLFGPDRAVFFQPDGSACFHPRVPRCWRIETGVLATPFAFDVTPEAERRIKAAAGYVTMIHERAGSGWGDEDRGGDTAPDEEIEQLRGVNDDGSPRGLTVCETCGEHRGRCLDPLRPDTAMVLPVSCRCQNINRCARCGNLLHARRLDANYYRPQDGLLIYVPGIAAARHRCPNATGEDRFNARVAERSWSVN
ncbi:MAG: hypothetical protein M3R55_05365 [Acidobacteriota bacterium]|nr:hypothetical protein [Acidobacteriota bacterium]